MRDIRTLRSLSEQRLRGIPIPQPFDLQVFAAAVGAKVGRPVEIHDLPTSDSRLEGVSGAWLSTDRAEIIHLEPGTSGWHRDLIALHEFGHLLSNHPTDPDWDREQLAKHFPGLSPEALDRMRFRHARDGYSYDEEEEAEMIASVILDRADIGPPPDVHDSGSLQSRLAEALRHPLRHV